MSRHLGRLEQCGARIRNVADQPVAVHFGDVRGEYEALDQGCALHDRSYRGLIEVRGGDRATWLHNLTTNEIKSLQPGDGNYVFALNVKGRILFDANVWALEDLLLVDVDRRWIDGAIEHMNRFIIMEDVQLERSDSVVRLAVIGPKAGEGVVVPVAAGSMTALQHAPVSIDGVDCRLVRHDFCGPFGAEFIVPVAGWLQVWSFLTEAGQSGGIRPVGLDAVEIRRVEAGLPWSLEDIDGEVLPAETRQMERAVSFQKGCYLGQEVVERMRAHGSVARLLVGLALDEQPVEPGAVLHSDGQAVGRVTSVVEPIEAGRRIGLGYVKAAVARAGQPLQADAESAPVNCQVCELPFKQSGLRTGH